MINKYIYLDNAATTKPYPEVVDKMLPFLYENYGNPSSIYSLGSKSKVAIEKSRNIISKYLKCSSSEIFFTSSGTEADNWAIKGIAEKHAELGKHIITSKIEHPAILNTCKYLEAKGYEVTYLDVDSKGLINIEELQKAVREDTILVSIMFANNEIGTIQPIKEIGFVCKENNVIFHTDAVQAFGAVDINLDELNIDLMSISGHKINGPKGIGFLYIRENIEINNFINGGMQERGKRASTENVSGIVGLAEAVKITFENKEEKVKIIEDNRNYFLNNIIKSIEDSKLNGDLENRLPNNINISFPGASSESVLMALDINNIAASSGSACSSGAIEPSHVLKALKLEDEDLRSSIRFSLNSDISKEDIDYVVKSLMGIIPKIREY